MKYDLTDEQVEYIQTNYCDSKEAILLIANILNNSGIVKSEEDFLELVSNASSRYQTAQLQVLSGLSKYGDELYAVKPIYGENDEKPINIHALITEYMPIEEMVKRELIYKYFEDFDHTEEEPDFVETEDDIKTYFQLRKKRK